MAKTKLLLPVRELFKLTPSEVRDGFRNNVTMVFEDDVQVDMTYREVILLRYIMNIYSAIPNVKIVSSHNFMNYYSHGILTSKTINKSFEAILKDTVRIYVKPKLDRTILPELYKLMYKIVNEIYNDLIYEILEYVNSISIFDLLDVQMDKDLIASMKEVHNKKDVDSVNKTYDVLDKVLRTKEELKDNIVAKGYISGTVNANQVKQLLASRGYVTEIDSHIFKYPIASSFTLGMSNIYDLSIESRAGAKALFLSNKAVQESEYFARELQLITMVVEKLVDADCGNTDYMDWLVRTKEMCGKSDLDNLLGKYYFNPDTGKEEVITKDHKHLEGKTIKLRTAINCRLADQTCVCIKCFGDLSYTIPKHSNIGHYSATEVTQKLTQSILSTKHLATSATGSESTLDEVASKFFLSKNNNYVFRANILDKAKTKYYMIIDTYSAFGVKDLNPNVDVYKLNPSRVSRIDSIIIMAKPEKGDAEYYPITIRDHNRFGNFTYEFLEHIVSKGFILDDLDRYVIDLEGWNHKFPVISMPELEYNFLALARNIKSLFKNIDIKKDGKSSETPEALLQKVFDMVNTKLDVNIALLEIIVYAFTVKSLEFNDYNLGRNVENKQLGRFKHLMSYRSLGAGYAWQDVTNMILSPRSYYGTNVMSHPMDVMIKPNDVINTD